MGLKAEGEGWGGRVRMQARGEGRVRDGCEGEG